MSNKPLDERLEEIERENKLNQNTEKQNPEEPSPNNDGRLEFSYTPPENVPKPEPIPTYSHSTNRRRSSNKYHNPVIGRIALIGTMIAVGAGIWFYQDNKTTPSNITPVKESPYQHRNIPANLRTITPLIEAPKAQNQGTSEFFKSPIKPNPLEKLSTLPQPQAAKVIEPTKATEVVQAQIEVNSISGLQNALQKGIKKISVREGNYIVNKDLLIPAGVSVTLEGGQFSFGHDDGITVKGELKDSNKKVLFTKNTNSGWENITVDGGKLQLSNSTLEYGNGLTYSRRNSSIREPVHQPQGGLISLLEGEVFIGNETILQKGNAYQGGAIFVQDGELICEGRVRNNKAVYSGGGIHIEDGDITIDCHVYNNTSEYKGGGIHIEGGEILSDGYNYGNSAEMGGGIYIGDGNLELKSSLEKNNAVLSGGGIYISDGNVKLQKLTTISQNTSNYGAGVYLDNGTFESRGIITQNKAKVAGGGVYIDEGKFIDKSTLLKVNQPDDIERQK